MTADQFQKRYYTFTELISRLQISEKDLRHFVAEGELIPSIFLERGRYRLYQMDEVFGDSLSPVAVEDGQDPGDGTVQQWLFGLHYLVLPRLTAVNHCEFQFASKKSTDHKCGDFLHGLEGWTDIDDVFSAGVVMAEELDRFLATKTLKAEKVMAEHQFAKRERDTLLTIIAVLCNEAKIDYTKPAKAAGLILGTADRMGVSIGESTIEGHLKKIPDALGTRMK